MARSLQREVHMYYTDLTYLGKHKDGSHAFMEVREGKVYRTLFYDLVTTGSGSKVMSHCGSGYPAFLARGRTVSTGDDAPKGRKLPRYLERSYEANVSHCERCGEAWDTDDLSYPNTAGCRGTGDGIMCVGCLEASDLLMELNEASDLFKARNVQGVSLDGFEVVKVLFCDSSGFGSPGEAALTVEQAEVEAQSILDAAEGPLFVGLTGVGQFQVYVTVYREASARKAA